MRQVLPPFAMDSLAERFVPSRRRVSASVAVLKCVLGVGVWTPRSVLACDDESELKMTDRQFRPKRPMGRPPGTGESGQHKKSPPPTAKAITIRLSWGFQDHEKFTIQNLESLWTSASMPLSYYPGYEMPASDCLIVTDWQKSL